MSKGVTKSIKVGPGNSLETFQQSLAAYQFDAQLENKGVVERYSEVRVLGCQDDTMTIRLSKDSGQKDLVVNRQTTVLLNHVNGRERPEVLISLEEQGLLRLTNLQLLLDEE